MPLILTYSRGRNFCNLQDVQENIEQMKFWWYKSWWFEFWSMCCSVMSQMIKHMLLTPEIRACV